MNPDTHDRSYDDVLQSHRSLNQLLNEICEAADADALKPLLHQLDAELKEHFKLEESPDGFGASISEAAPHRAPAVQRLFAQHGEFLTALDKLRRAVGEGSAGDLGDSAKELCRRIREHEAEENDLLTEAMNTDLGGRG